MEINTINGPFYVGIFGPQCGKSKILMRFMKNEYIEDDDPTVEDNYKATINVDGNSAKLVVLDTSGNDLLHRTLQKIYSIASLHSFDYASHMLLEIEKVRKSRSFPLVIVGACADLEPMRKITQKEGLSIAYRYKCPYIEASAKTGANINQIFQVLVREIRKFYSNESSRVAPSNSFGEKYSTDQVIKSGKIKIKSKRRWAALRASGLYLYKSEKDLLENKNSKLIQLTDGNIKIKEREIEIENINKHIVIRTKIKKDAEEWAEKIRATISKTTDITRSEMFHESIADILELEWKSILMSSPENNLCADCGAANPDWCSINLGVLICIQCSGIHRSIGSRITIVKSLTIDTLSDELYHLLKIVGNQKANKLWEANVPANHRKARPHDNRSKKEMWIRGKYELKLFLPKKLSNEKEKLNKMFYDAIGNDDLMSAMSLYAQGAEINYVNSLENDQTGLHKAAKEGFMEIVTWLLLCQNISLNIANAKGLTAAELAEKNGRKIVAEYIAQSLNQEISQSKNLYKSLSVTAEDVTIIEKAEEDLTVSCSDFEFVMPEISVLPMSPMTQHAKLQSAERAHMYEVPVIDPARHEARIREAEERQRHAEEKYRLLEEESSSEMSQYYTDSNYHLTNQGNKRNAIRNTKFEGSQFSPNIGSLAKWTLTIVGPSITLKTKIDPTWTAKEMMERMEKKFPEDTKITNKAIFVETALYYLLLDSDMPMNFYEQIYDSCQVLLRDKSFVGTRLKPVKEAVPRNRAKSVSLVHIKL